MKTLLIVLFLCIFSLSKGQFTEPKFGAIETSEMLMKGYDKDTTASALFLFDIGNSRFILNNDVKFQFEYERHCRIKIFKKSAFNLADVNVKLYQSEQRKEELKNLKAVTYNLVDGKIVKTKLDNSKIYKTEGDNFVNMKFAFPEVREGSVIELSYVITSDFLYNFRGWNFQYRYPALWSEYSCSIPEYFEYRKTTKGYLKFDVNDSKQEYVTFSIPTTTISKAGLSDPMFARTVAGKPEIIKVIAPRTVLAVKDVPAFISEPNIDCEENYLQSIGFELSSIQLPNQLRKNYAQSWESVNTQMKTDKDFGLLMKTKGFIEDTVSALCNNWSTDIEKAIGIYNYVQKRMKWDGNYNIWAMKGLKKPFTDRVGSSSEINLLLTLMLQTAGLKANPVLFSTRENGIFLAYYPTISKFNSVLTKVDIGGKVYLLDAVNKYCPFGVLPAEDINGNGRVVDDIIGDWVNLEKNEKYKVEKNYILEISPDGKMGGLVTGNYDGYAGIEYRSALSAEKNNDDYIRKVQENLKGLVINKYSISDRNNIYKPVSDTLHVEITEHAEIVGDKILLNPLLFEKIERNRYTLEERKYPVNYNYPIMEVYTFSFTVPKGYQVESLPQPVSLNMPDNSISITYNIQNTDNKINVEYRRDINKILFLPNEYKTLKDLYDQIVRKHAELIILKKSV